MGFAIARSTYMYKRFVTRILYTIDLNKVKHLFQIPVPTLFPAFE